MCIYVGRKEGKWYIMSVNDIHSHDLSPQNLGCFRGTEK